MPIFDSIRAALRPKEPEVQEQPQPSNTIGDEKADEKNVGADVSPQDASSLENSETELQRGVEEVEAVTKSWSKGMLVAVFIKYDLPTMFMDVLRRRQADTAQHLVALPRQCVPGCDPVQSDSLRHERL
jgi:hypothetical protein